MSARRKRWQDDWKQENRREAIDSGARLWVVDLLDRAAADAGTFEALRSQLTELLRQPAWDTLHVASFARQLCLAVEALQKDRDRLAATVARVQAALGATEP